MADKANKVKFNLKNAHYALLMLGEDGSPTYAAPVPMPGSVSISLDANGEPENFYADGVAYYVINNNMGYDGDLELAMIPESFRTDVLRNWTTRASSLRTLMRNWPLLRCSLNLTVIRSISVMCCITALRPAPASRVRPTRTARKFRRRR